MPPGNSPLLRSIPRAGPGAVQLKGLDRRPQVGTCALMSSEQGNCGTISAANCRAIGVLLGKEGKDDVSRAPAQRRLLTVIGAPLQRFATQ